MSEIESKDAIVEETAARVPDEDLAAPEKQEEKSHEKHDKSSKKTIKLESALAAALAERDDNKDKYLRSLAEFNNYKKRTTMVRSEAYKDGQYDVVEKILPVLDNMERAMEHLEGDQDGAVAQGLTMVYKLLAETIQKIGVKEIPAFGEAFDPTRHQAIQMLEAKEGETPGHVAVVVQKGYMTDDKVIRHSMVVVNK